MFKADIIASFFHKTRIKKKKKKRQNQDFKILLCDREIRVGGRWRNELSNL